MYIVWNSVQKFNSKMSLNFFIYGSGTRYIFDIFVAINFFFENSFILFYLSIYCVEFLGFLSIHSMEFPRAEGKCSVIFSLF
jgi:hypothetical protein